MFLRRIISAISLLFPVIVPTLIVRNLRLASFINRSRLFCGSPCPLLVLLRRWHNASLTGDALALSTYRKLCGICFLLPLVLRPAGTRHQPSSFIRAWDRLRYGLACPPSGRVSMFANGRSQFLLDRIGRCIKLFVSTDSTSCHHLADKNRESVFLSAAVGLYRM